MNHSSTPRRALDIWAADLAIIHLGDLGDRWTHTQAVAIRAQQAIETLTEADRPLLLAAAWLHDLGYAPDIAHTGFHPLDGARYLEMIGAPHRLISLVAHHSCARYEANQRDLLSQLDRYERELGAVADALIYADMTTGPTGGGVGVEERLAEILRRYQPEDPVHRAVVEASGEIEAAVSRVERRLAELLDHPI